MRTIGLLGGMSWLSTALYYRALNEGVRERRGGFHSAAIVLWSLDFAEVQRLQRDGDLAGETALLVDAARRVETAGADCVLICSNTMHRLAAQVDEAIGIPLIHIVDSVGEALAAAGHRRVGLAGTRLALEDDMYPSGLAERYGVEVITPGEEDRATLQAVVEREFDADQVSATGREAVRGVLERLVAAGADGVVLACTSLGRLVGSEPLAAPAYDSALLHTRAALDWASAAQASERRAAAS